MLAAGLGTRYGDEVKQLAPVGPSGETLMEYALFDAARAGFTGGVVVTRRDLADRLRERLGATAAEALPVELAFQDLSPGAPRGSVPALLAAGGRLNGPFAVANADVFYGREAYRRLAGHLAEVGGAPGTEPAEGARAGPAEHALVTWRLEDTAPEAWEGGVSRAVCELEEGVPLEEGARLRRIVEVRGIRPAGSGTSFTGRTLRADPHDEGEAVRLSGAEPVSRNLWGFTHAVLGPLRAGLRRFRERTAGQREAVQPEGGRPQAGDEQTGDPTPEYLLSTAVDEILRRGEGHVRAYAAREPAFGMTYPRERAVVAGRIRRLVREGRYPEHLRDGFREEVDK